MVEHQLEGIGQGMDDLLKSEKLSSENSEPTTGRDRKKRAETNVIKLLPKIIEAARWGHHDTTEKIGLDIAQAIEATHPAISQKIIKQFAATLRPTRIVHRPEALVDFCEARHGLDEVLLPELIEMEMRAIVTEHQRASDLAQFKLAPRHKILLYGPPGNGKTLLAEALAMELDLPFLPVKYAGMIESYLGSTGKNLQSIFDYAAIAPCVLFMDEFDGVAIDRGDSKDVGEIRRVTNQLLILLDRLPPTCLFVAATNADELLDRAIQRRFDYVLEIPTPTRDLRELCAKRELAPSLTPGHNVSHHAEIIADLPLPNLSALVKLCQRVRRDLVLNQGAGVQNIIAEAGQTERAT